MDLKILLVLPLVTFFSELAVAQKLKLLHEGRNVSLRGLSVVTDKVLWVSGSNGTVGKSADGGNSWTWQTVPGFETRDFRDVYAVDEHTAVIMAVAEPAVILRTTDAGRSWMKVFSDSTKGMFLDAMDINPSGEGMVIGDPIAGYFYIATTSDGGASWKPETRKLSIPADSGEACFAASGTNLRSFGRNHFALVTGGSKSRLVIDKTMIDLPILQGSSTSGANSLASFGEKGSRRFVVVGGDFNDPSSRDRNCFVTADGGKSWIKPTNPPNGYRSCVEFLDADRLVTCGITGVDVSLNKGINWDAVSETGFHVCQKARKGNAVFLAGTDGRIGLLVW